MDLLNFAKTARVDMLDAVRQVPTDVAISRPRFGIPFVIASQFNTASEVLVADHDSYVKPWLVRSIIRDALGDNLFTANGDEWLNRRQLVAPVFAHNQVQSRRSSKFSTGLPFVSTHRRRRR